MNVKPPAGVFEIFEKNSLRLSAVPDLPVLRCAELLYCKNHEVF